jgi:hypothetical protein
MSMAELSLDELQSLLEQSIAKHHEPRQRYADRMATNDSTNKEEDA